MIDNVPLATVRPQYSLRPGALLFYAGCNKQVFSPKPWKKLAQIHLVVFKKKAKNAPIIPKYDVTKPKARLL